MSKLVKEAIAEAKAVMDMATENAKIALGEHFQREVTGIFQNKIKEEIAAEEANLQEKLKPSGIGKGVGKSSKPTKQAHTNVVKQPREKFFEGEEEDDQDEVVHESAVETPHEVSYEEEEEGNQHREITDDELEEILNSLSEEADADPSAPAPQAPPAPPADPSAQMDTNAPAPQAPPVDPAAAPVDPNAPAPQAPPVAEMHHEEEDEDEGIDLEELLREIDGTNHEEEEQEGVKHDDEEEEDEQEESVKHEEEGKLHKENAALRKELNEHVAAIQYLREQFKDVNLLNAKLLYTNKLFHNYGLSKKQKINIIEKFDLATTLREVKYAYSILAESFNNSGASAVRKNTAVKSITEGLASSKPLASTKPSEAIVGNVNEMVNRFQHLANIKTSGKK